MNLKMDIRQHGDFCVSGELLESLSKSCVDIMDGNAGSAIAVHDTLEISKYIPRIETTYSYLYSQFAIEQFGVDESIARNIQRTACYRKVLQKEPEKQKEKFFKRIFKKRNKIQALPSAVSDKGRNFKDEYKVDVPQYIPQQYNGYEQNRDNDMQYDNQWNR